MNFKEIGWDSVGWTDLAQDGDKWQAVLKATIDLRGP
jgi:hypothetical protein